MRTDDKCLRLDPATGKRLSTFVAPEPPAQWGIVACVGDTLIGTRANTGHLVTFRFKPGNMQTQWTESNLLFALDAATGKLKWTWQPQRSLRHNALAIGGGRVYVIDRAIAVSDRQREQKRGIPDPGFAHPAGRLVALDLASGKVVWESDEDIFGTLLALSEEHQTLLMCYQDWRFKLASELGKRMAAFDTATGHRRWDIKATYSTRAIIHGRTVYLQPGAWDLLTGEPTGFKFSRYYGCGIPCASQNLMVFRSGTLGYVDLRHPRGTHSFGGIRPGCWVNAIPAGGLVLMPDATDRCTCSYLVKASIALEPWGLNAPLSSPSGGVSATPLEVTLAADAPDIRYTLDGSAPTADSARYAGPITVSKTATLKARAFGKGIPPSQVSEASFVIDARPLPLDGPA